MAGTGNDSNATPDFIPLGDIGSSQAMDVPGQEVADQLDAGQGPELSRKAAVVKAQQLPLQPQPAWGPTANVPPQTGEYVPPTVPINIQPMGPTGPSGAVVAPAPTIQAPADGNGQVPAFGPRALVGNQGVNDQGSTFQRLLNIGLVPPRTDISGELKEQAAGQAQQQSAALDKAALDQQKLAAVIEGAKKIQAQQAANVDYIQFAERNRSDALKQAQDQYDASLHEALSAKVDPSRYWNDLSGAQKFGNALALVLGAIGGAFSPSMGNVALKLLEKGINDDVDAQKVHVENLMKRPGFKANALQMLSTKFGSDRAGEQALRALKLDMAANDIETKVKELGLQGDALVQANDIIGRLRAQGAEKRAGLLLQAGELADRRSAAMIRLYTATTKDGVPDQGDSVANAIANKIPEKQRPAAYKELEKRQLLEKAIKNIDLEFKQADEEGVAGLMPWTTAKANQDTRRVTLMTTLMKIAGRQLSDRDVALLNGALPRPTDTSDQVRAKGEKMKNIFRQYVSTPLLDHYNILPTTER